MGSLVFCAAEWRPCYERQSGGSRLESSRQTCDRASFLGIRQYGNALWKVHSTCCRYQHSREIQRRRTGARGHRSVPNSGTACSMGSTKRTERRARGGETGQTVFHSSRIDQPEHFSKSGVQIWLSRESRACHSAHSNSAHFGLSGDLCSFGLTAHLTMVR